MSLAHHANSLLICRACATPRCRADQAKLADLFPSLQVVVEKKADSKFVVVSAASICAKVPRDLLLHHWPCDDDRVCSDREWGCGYPGDKDTQRWLKQNLHPVFGWPDLVRFSWGPSLEALDKNPQSHGACVVRWPEEEGDTAEQQQRASMAAFLGKRQKTVRHCANVLRPPDYARAPLHLGGFTRALCPVDHVRACMHAHRAPQVGSGNCARAPSCAWCRALIVTVCCMRRGWSRSRAGKQYVRCCIGR